MTTRELNWRVHHEDAEALEVVEKEPRARIVEGESCVR